MIDVPPRPTIDEEELRALRRNLESRYPVPSEEEDAHISTRHILFLLGGMQNKIEATAHNFENFVKQVTEDHKASTEQREKVLTTLIDINTQLADHAKQLHKVETAITVRGLSRILTFLALTLIPLAATIYASYVWIHKHVNFGD